MRALALGLILTLGIVACDPDEQNQLKNTSGDFDGFVVKKIGQTSRQIFISAHLNVVSDVELTLSAQSKESPETWTVEVFVDSSSSIRFKAESLFSGIAELTGSAEKCFRSGPDFPEGQLKVCVDPKEISFSFVQKSGDEFTLVADRRIAEEHPVLEAPANYTVDDLVERGKNQSFSSLIKFQQAMQSRLNAQTAQLNLLPHVSPSDILGFFFFAWAQAARLAGDVVPFLLPTNWFNAWSSGFQFEADYQALLLVKADTGNIVEGLAYSVLRDQRVLAMLKRFQEPYEELRNTLVDRERLGLIPQGSSDPATLVLHSLLESQNLLENAVGTEMTALAQASGFLNPQAITQLSSDHGYRIDEPLKVNLESMQKLAIERSIELKQVDALIRAAQSNLKGRYFSWLDPTSGNPGIGFGLPSYIDAGAAKVEELKASHSQVQSLLMQKVANSINEIGSSLELYRLAQANSVLQENRVQQLRDSMRLGLEVDTMDLLNAIQGLMKSSMSGVNSEFTYYISVSRLNRLLFMGPYLDIYSKIGEREKP